MQQIGRMGLEMDQAIQRSFSGKVVPLASRCSVHCKSDITHKLNRNEATAEDILHTLHDSMSNKVIALLEKGTREPKRVLVIGGVTRNAAMLAALRGQLSATEFIVLPESPWFEAWGSALILLLIAWIADSRGYPAIPLFQAMMLLVLLELPTLPIQKRLQPSTFNQKTIMQSWLQWIAALGRYAMA